MFDRQAVSAGGLGWALRAIYRPHEPRLENELSHRREVGARLQRPAKASMKALPDAQSELLALYDAAPFAVCVLSLDLRWIRINTKMAEINGIPVEAHIGQSVYQLLPDIADAAAAIVRRVIETGASVIGGEIMGETPARPGRQRTWVVNYSPIRDAAGRIAAILVIAEEVTGARIGDEQRRHLIQLIEQSNDLISLARVDGQVTYVNRAGRRMIGLADDAPLDGILFGDYVAPACKDMFVAEVLPAVRQRGSWVGTTQLLNRQTGRIVDAHRSSFALHDRDGKFAGYGTLLRDVTEAKATHAALAESEERLRLATAAGGIGVFDWNIRTGELTWDQRQRELWALPPDTEVTLETFWAGVHPGDRRRVEAAVSTALDPASAGDYEIEFRVIGLTDGVERHIAARAKVTFENGAATRMIGTVVDRTLQRQAEAVLARDRSELEALVAERTRDLQQTQARLAQAEKLSALGQLAGGVAHDFNNVLQAVQNAATLIERKPDDPDAVRRLARMALDASERGSAVARRLLAFARQGDLHATPVAPAALLRDMREIFVHTLGAGVTVRVDAPAGLPPMLVDKEELEVVLVNLAANARDAMAGAGALTLSAEVDRVDAENGLGRAAGLKPGTYMRLSVHDTGAGMSPEVLARATEPFFTTKANGHGTGLGLAMARGFVEQSGGLHIESATGQGAVVRLWFPLAAETPAAPEPASEAAIASERQATRLTLVDDEPFVRELLSEQLKSAGFDVAAFPDATTALASLGSGKSLDLVIADSRCREWTESP